MLLRQRLNSIKKIILENPDLESFCLGDCSSLKYQYDKWVEHLPRVYPFYAVKCNPLPEIVNYLSKMPKMGYDCASSQEILQALDTNVKKENIIYANPCKSISHLKFARAHDVPLTTFDSEQELHKIKAFYPDASLVIRIAVEEYSTLHSLKDKFGASLKYAKKLIQLAKNMSLSVVGVSFHVGSGNKSPESYYYAIKDCKEIIDYTKKELGVCMNLLDLGGGFSGSEKDVQNGKFLFNIQAEFINQALHDFFPESQYSEGEFRIIAEPGKFFADSALMLAAVISSKKILKDGEQVMQDEKLSPDKVMYYINQGVYSGFMSVFTETKPFEPLAVFSNGELEILSSSSKSMINSVLWGPTCDSHDLVDKGTQLPLLEIGDWIIYDYFGSYTTSILSEFNGFRPPKIFWINNKD